MASKYDVAWVAKWQGVINAQAITPVIGKKFTCKMLVGFGDQEFVLDIREGRVVNVEQGLTAESVFDFALRAPVSTWDQFTQDPPPPYFNDIWAMRSPLCHPTKEERMVVEGDTIVVWQHNRSIDRILDMTRKV